MIYKLLWKIKGKFNFYYHKYEQSYKQDIFRQEMGFFGEDCDIGNKAFIRSPLNKLFLGKRVFVEDYSTL
ncbi:MAG: hypothetical protein AAFW70_24920, partial [Cyanobacteria bacterium J06635_10]